MLTITNGFTYIAFLMLLAGGLLALEKYMKWKIFNIVPPLVWIYIFNMFFCTIGLYNSDECSAAYSALKNNILYAMIFVMLLRCEARKTRTAYDLYLHGLCHHPRHRILRSFPAVCKCTRRC